MQSEMKLRINIEKIVEIGQKKEPMTKFKIVKN
jgi:hypothetical protein